MSAEREEGLRLRDSRLSLNPVREMSLAVMGSLRSLPAACAPAQIVFLSLNSSRKREVSRLSKTTGWRTRVRVSEEGDGYTAAYQISDCMLEVKLGGRWMDSYLISEGLKGNRRRRANDGIGQSTQTKSWVM